MRVESEAGRGSIPWIFLRGLTRGSGHWGGFVAEFEAALPGVQVLTLDTSGNGTRFRGRSPTTVGAMARDCRAQLHTLGIAPPYRLLALSLGGMVAAHWVSHWPDEVDRAVLVSTSMRPVNPFFERLRPENYLPLLGLLARRANALQWEQEILQRTSKHPGTDVLAEWVKLRENQPVSAANALRQVLAAARFRLGPQPLDSKKLLVLAGAGDTLVSPECSLALAKAWNCAMARHPTAGHDVTLDAGPWVAEQVARWA